MGVVGTKVECKMLSLQLETNGLRLYIGRLNGLDYIYVTKNTSPSPSIMLGVRGQIIYHGERAWEQGL